MLQLGMMIISNMPKPIDAAISPAIFSLIGGPGRGGGLLMQSPEKNPIQAYARSRKTLHFVGTLSIFMLAVSVEICYSV